VGKIRRDNYVFLTWIGDHSPRHVHVYRDGKLILKLIRLIASLRKDGLL
jgi:hypothetical protein